GPNTLQNFPVLSSAVVSDGPTDITGTLDTSSGTQTIDFYASAACDPSGNGEGARWIGDSVVTANGPTTFDTGEEITGSVTEGDVITATATGAAGNTSEFSACLVATSGKLAGLGLTADEPSVPAGATN